MGTQKKKLKEKKPERGERKTTDPEGEAEEEKPVAQEGAAAGAGEPMCLKTNPWAMKKQGEGDAAAADSLAAVPAGATTGASAPAVQKAAEKSEEPSPVDMYLDTAAVDTTAVDTTAVDTAAVDTAAVDTAAVDTAAVDAARAAAAAALG